jgi:tRNA modification GTPase
VDTAGIRKTTDPVEQEGVRRTESQIENSDLILFVFDGSRQAFKEEIDKVRELCEKAGKGQSRTLVVINKIDLPDRLNGEIFEQVPLLTSIPAVRVSARTGEGMDELKKQMVGAIFSKKLIEPGKSVTVTNIRHHRALTQAMTSLELSLQSLNDGMSGELVAVDLRAALDKLGEITGAVTTDDILNNIFSKFCIGK